MERRSFYKPKGEGSEARIKERMERWAALRAEKNR
jgi:putative ATPase